MDELRRVLYGISHIKWELIKRCSVWQRDGDLSHLEAFLTHSSAVDVDCRLAFLHVASCVACGSSSSTAIQGLSPQTERVRRQLGRLYRLDLRGLSSAVIAKESERSKVKELDLLMGRMPSFWRSAKGQKYCHSRFWKRPKCATGPIC